MHKETTLAQAAREIHENAVNHGWWDEEREAAEIYALIHSEWSEALEEYRAKREDVWFVCDKDVFETECTAKERAACACYKPEKKCVFQSRKPEGICVELIDGVIRILDYLEKKGGAEDYTDGTADYYLEMQDEEGVRMVKKWQALTLPALVNRLHIEVCGADSSRLRGDEFEADVLLEAVTIAWQWIKGRGLDPMELLIEKHEYNKTRPYKHGKVC